MAKPPRMQDDYSTPIGRGTPLIQAALALLVAGTLVAFSALAFRTGFADDSALRAVTASDIGQAGGAVVLPALGPSADREAPRRPPADGRIAITGATDEPVVLGTRVDDAGVQTADGRRDDHRGRGLGHAKARGEAHNRDDNGNHDGDGAGPDDDTAAREEDDGDDHSDEADDRHDDDGNDASYGSRSGSGSSGRSGPRRRGSGGHGGSPT